MPISNYAGSNKVLKTLYEAKGVYSTLKVRLDAMEANAGGGAGVSSQLTKLGVVGSVGTPNVTDITIDSSPDFLRGAVEILKFVAGANNIVQTICSFNNGDSTSFTSNPYVIFDGVMKLKTSDTYAMTNDGVLGTGKVFSYTFDRTLTNTKSISIS